MWFLLHSAAVDYPINPSYGEQREMKYLLAGLPALVPCSICRGHLRKWIMEYPIHMDSIVQTRANLFQYILDMHNSVNMRTNAEPWTFARAARAYGLEL